MLGACNSEIGDTGHSCPRGVQRVNSCPRKRAQRVGTRGVGEGGPTSVAQSSFRKAKTQVIVGRAAERSAGWRTLRDVAGRGSHRTQTRTCVVCLGVSEALVGGAGRRAGTQSGDRCVPRESGALHGQNPPCAQEDDNRSFAASRLLVGAGNREAIDGAPWSRGSSPQSPSLPAPLWDPAGLPGPQASLWL